MAVTRPERPVGKSGDPEEDEEARVWRVEAAPARAVPMRGKRRDGTGPTADRPDVVRPTREHGFEVAEEDERPSLRCRRCRARDRQERHTAPRRPVEVA